MSTLQKNLFLLLLAIASIGIGLWFGLQNKSGRSPYAHLGGNFTLESVNCPVSLSDFNGKVSILYFGYTLHSLKLAAQNQFWDLVLKGI